MFYIGDLFQWERFITPSIIKLFYWLVVIIVILAGLSGLVTALGTLFVQSDRRRVHGDRELRRHAGRHPVRPHRGGIHPDGVPDQRAPGGDPQSRRDVISLSSPDAAIRRSDFSTNRLGFAPGGSDVDFECATAAQSVPSPSIDAKWEHAMMHRSILAYCTSLSGALLPAHARRRRHQDRANPQARYPLARVASGACPALYTLTDEGLDPRLGW